MSGVLGILTILVGLAGLVCYVMVLVKLFQQEGTLKGILGIICGIYTLIWGWINAGKLGITTIMLIWSILIVLSIIFNLATRAMIVPAVQ